MTPFQSNLETHTPTSTLNAAQEKKTYVYTGPPPGSVEYAL